MPDENVRANFVEDLYKIALEMYRYVHTDVWSGQRYYTTLNVAIISISFSAIGALQKLSPFLRLSVLVTVPLFSIGLIISIFAYRSLRGLRKAFLQVIWFKTLVEQALEKKLLKVFDEAKIEMESFRKTNVEWRPTPVYDMPDKDHEKILKCKDIWIKENIIHKGGITYYFIMLQGAFVAINLFGIITAIVLAFL